ncbi:MAG: rod shape-determining protein MreD [Bacteroidota bacterium]
MNSKAIFRIVVYFLNFLALQWLVARNLNLGGIAFCHAYIGAILLLPIEFNAVMVLLLAFASGLMTDVFYDTPGLHAAAAVFAAWLRHLNQKILTPAGGYEDYMEVSVGSMGLRWYLLFMLPVLFFHSLMLFLLEYASLDHILLILAKAAASSAFTLIIILIVQNALYRPQGNR